MDDLVASVAMKICLADGNGDDDAYEHYLDHARAAIGATLLAVYPKIDEFVEDHGLGSELADQLCKHVGALNPGTDLSGKPPETSHSP